MEFAYGLAQKYICDNGLPIEQKDNDELEKNNIYTWPSPDYGDEYPTYLISITKDILEMEEDIINTTTIEI